MSDRKYTLRELAASVDLRPRTVRSYIQKGLLRGPDRLGPAATYSEDHAVRLRLIRALRDRGVSLGEIRRALQSVASGDVEKVLAGKMALPAPPGERRIPDGELPYRNLDRLLSTLRELTGDSSVASGPAGEFWHRILVTPDIEFLVREGFSPEALFKLHKLADHIRFHLQGGSLDE